MSWSVPGVLGLEALVMCLLDAGYLTLNRTTMGGVIEGIQRGPLRLRLGAMVLCYLVMILGLWWFVLRLGRPWWEGALLGGLVYGVYDTTMYATLTGYPLWAVLMDWSWGVVLFGTTAWVVGTVTGGPGVAGGPGR